VTLMMIELTMMTVMEQAMMMVMKGRRICRKIAR
jgi:hypothetical protein